MRDGADVMEVRREHARGKVIRFEDKVIQKESKVAEDPQRSSISPGWQDHRQAERAGFERARASPSVPIKVETY